MKRVYLAARYSRREELVGYKQELEKLGYDVQARWLQGDHQLDNNGVPIGSNGERLVEEGSPEAVAIVQKFLNHDIDDCLNADLIICFTEAPRQPFVGRGGRHVEFGLALGMLLRGLPVAVVVIGYRENLFHYHPELEFYDDWDQFVSGLVKL